MEDRRENKSTSKKSKKDDVKKKKQEKNNTRTNSNTPDENKIYSEIKNNIRSYGIIILLVLMVLLSIYLQYRHERALRLSKVSDDEVQENYYEVLGVNQNADLATIRKQYKELTKIWHPDKNPGCKPCHDKFLLISKAYEVLSDDVKKGELDSKGKSIFSSQPVQLTVKNYHHLVEESNDFWVILIYENTRGNNYNKFVAEVWDEVSSKNNNIVKFGVIDVLQNENILHFLPYKFQFYPNIITYLHGEGSELFQNIESFSVKTFTQFIEDSFSSRVKLIDEYGLSTLITKSQSAPREVANIKYEDIDINLLILTPRNYVDLVAKDFAKNYHHSLHIYQNEMGTYDKFLKNFNSKGDHRVYIQYNEIVQSEDKKISLKNVLKPLPVLFKSSSRMSERLQVAFNIVKSLTLQKIYKNNYAKHCVGRINIQGENVVERNENETKINMCVILLEHDNDLNTAGINSVFYQNLFENFNKRLKKASTPGGNKSQSSEEYIITANFGTTKLESNKRLLKLFKDFSAEKNLVAPKESTKLLFIINDTQEKFTFKYFKDEQQMKEFLEDFDKSDFFEDYSFSFDHFINYGLTEIKEVFNEEKVFSYEKIISTSFYAQMQPAYIFSFILISLANIYLKIDYLSLICLGISIVLNLLWQIYNSLNY